LSESLRPIRAPATQIQNGLQAGLQAAGVDPAVHLLRLLGEQSADLGEVAKRSSVESPAKEPVSADWCAMLGMSWRSTIFWIRRLIWPRQPIYSIRRPEFVLSRLSRMGGYYTKRVEGSAARAVCSK
jgi:hypothetical protein